MDNANIQPAAASEQNYTVVARRYRPRTFQQLIGQDHVSQALSKAIATGRVGHAYLFTGARGVGKTSTARIFAKALNAGDDAEADIAKDISEAIDSGEDMDVIEIDGASNRGIEEIRQLRANVNVRPSRARYKIYIIDEVHMLTNQAFNALLKTLEEPPGHVKFIFCTTDPDKLPITVLSRCQRFDFAPVKVDSIQARLQEIVEAEGFEADTEALALLARRAAGSMRDSQSLLEQVMSFASGHITVEQVHALLGTADETQLIELTQALKQADGLAAISLVDRAVRSGSDAGQLAEQLLNYLRDVMAVGVGAGPDLLKLASPASVDSLRTLANEWGLQTILAAIQLLDEALVRMRGSVSALTLFEVALLQICQLEHMQTVASLLEAIMPRGAPGPVPAEKKKVELTGSHAIVPEIPNASTSAAAESTSVPAPHFPVGASAATRRLAAMAASIAGESDPSVGRVDASVSENTTPSIASTSSATPSSPLPGETPTMGNGSVIAGDNSPRREDKAVMAQPAGATSVAASSSPVVASSPVVTSSPTAASSPAATSSHAAGPAPAAARSVAAPPSPAAPASSSLNSPASGMELPKGSPQAMAEWQRSLKRIDGMLADVAGLAVVVEPVGSSAWNILFPPGSNKPREFCETPQRKAELTAAVEQTVGRSIQLSFAVIPGEVARPVSTTSNAALRVKRQRELSDHPFIKCICETLEGEIVRVDLGNYKN